MRRRGAPFLLTLWLCVWVVVSGLLGAVNAVAPAAPLLVKTCVVSGVMVPAMLYGIVPALRRLFNR